MLHPAQLPEFNNTSFPDRPYLKQHLYQAAIGASSRGASSGLVMPNPQYDSLKQVITMLKDIEVKGSSALAIYLIISNDSEMLTITTHPCNGFT